MIKQNDEVKYREGLEKFFESDDFYRAFMNPDYIQEMIDDTHPRCCVVLLDGKGGYEVKTMDLSEFNWSRRGGNKTSMVTLPWIFRYGLNEGEQDQVTRDLIDCEKSWLCEEMEYELMEWFAS